MVALVSLSVADALDVVPANAPAIVPFVANATVFVVAAVLWFAAAGAVNAKMSEPDQPISHAPTAVRPLFKQSS